MVPTPINLRARSTGFLYPFASLVAHHVPKLVNRLVGGDSHVQDGALNTLAKRAEEEPHDAKFIVFACLIPVLVLLSGLFAGLTLGYMSLDETQLHVLSVSGTPKQKAYAKKIEPIRKNGHLLLVTLLLANMIVNETLPVISDPVLGGGVQSVVVSTVLIVIFSEIIPQSLCTRYGLAIGANMAPMVRVMIYGLGIVSWPVAKLLEFILGPHHGIMYRRAELKELIAMHATTGELGGDLKTDTVAIIGATLDLQEKVVKQAMTPIDKVFMLNLDCKLDYDTLRQISDTGHSRVPVYEEVDVPLLTTGEAQSEKFAAGETKKMKKIVGILLVKQCLMLDPKDATPLRSLKLHHVPCVPNNMSLLYILDRFQDGRSHMAVISRFSEEKAESIKRQAKKGLTQRLKEHVGISDSSGTDTDSSDDESDAEGTGEGSANGSIRGSVKKGWRKSIRKKRRTAEVDVEKAEPKSEPNPEDVKVILPEEEKKEPTLPQNVWQRLMSTGREQRMPDDAVLAKEDVNEFLQSVDPGIAPLGIITLEDVLEEIIGEEIYDEFDAEGKSHLKSFTSPKAMRRGVSRGRDHHHGSPAISEGTTAVSVADPGVVSNEQIRISQSTPASPKLVGQADGPMLRTSSLGQSLGAFAFHRKNRPPTEETSLTVTGRNRSRSQQRNGRNDEGAPSSGVADRIAGVQEEDGARIPNEHERSGPDIAADEENRKE